MTQEKQKEYELKIPCLIYSRVVGYYSPVQTTWNPGKKEEFSQRKKIKIDKKTLTKKDI